MRAYLVLLLSSLAVAADPEARSWTPVPRALSAALTDADPQTFETICQGAYSDPIDAGLSWAEPRRQGKVTVEYVTLGGRAYQPGVAGQALEYWAGGGWRRPPRPGSRTVSARGGPLPRGEEMRLPAGEQLQIQATF